MKLDDLRPNFTYIEMLCLDDVARSRRWYRVSWEPTILGLAVVRMSGRQGQRKRTLPPLVFESLDEAWPEIRSIIEKRLAEGYSIQAPDSPAPGVTMYFGPASMTKEEIDAYEQLDLVAIAGDQIEPDNLLEVDNEAHIEIHDSLTADSGGLWSVPAAECDISTSEAGTS